MGYYIKRPYRLTPAHDYQQMATQFTNMHTLVPDDVTKIKDVIDNMMGTDDQFILPPPEPDIEAFLKWIQQDVDDDEL